MRGFCGLEDSAGTWQDAIAERGLHGEWAPTLDNGEIRKPPERHRGPSVIARAESDQGRRYQRFRFRRPHLAGGSSFELETGAGGPRRRRPLPHESGHERFKVCKRQSQLLALGTVDSL
jgi:hypothetical protein